MKKYIYAPHYDFFIDEITRMGDYLMDTFHFHKKFEIYYQINGSRKYFIGDTVYLVRSGDIVLIDQDTVHKTAPADPCEYTRIVFNFTDTALTPITKQFDGLDVFAPFHNGRNVYTPNASERKHIESLLKNLVRYQNKKGPEDIALRRLMSCELLVHIAQMAKRLENGPPDESGENSNQMVRDITHYITAHFSDDLNLTCLAEQFGVSTYYLSRLFKQVTSIGIVEYINSVRLQHAKNLLETTADSVEAVGTASGFHTTTHFTRTFKTSTGVAPQAYRKMYSKLRK